MENKSGSSGFIGTSIGVAMTIIQSTHPELFGNHPWILPASLLLIFAGLLFWVTQIAWIQRLLGLSRVEAVHTNLPSAEPKAGSRLKIISAHYGVEGISDPDVTHYLLERLHGNAFAEPIGADLFHGLDPIDGQRKRLKVHYAFDGKEATITRPQHAMLILPEDSFLRQQLDEIKQTHQDEMRRLEISNNAYLSNAQEARRQCEDERRKALAKIDELGAKLALFLPLQLEAFQLARELRQFLKESGARPSIRLVNGEEKNREMVAFHDWHVQFVARYKNRFAGKVKALSLKLNDAKPQLVSPLERWTEEVNNELDLQQCAQTLERMALELGAPGELWFTKAEIDAMAPDRRQLLKDSDPKFKALVAYYARL